MGNVAVGYIRVSTEEQADSGLSLAAQRKKIEAMATVKELQLSRVFEDAGESGCNLRRPAMGELLDMVAAGEVDTIIITKLDRLTRSVKDLGGLLETLDKRHVDLISTSESIDTSTATGRLLVNILGSVAQWEREIIAERTSAALQEKKSQGKQYCSQAVFGSAFVDGEIVEDAGEQELLEKVRELRADKSSWAKVAAHLTAEGYRTRTGGEYSRQGVYQIAKRAGVV